MRRTAPDVPTGVVLATVGGALLVLGAILPWSATAGHSFTGFDHVDGFVTFGIGVAVGIVGIEALAVERRWGWLGRGAAGLGSLAVLGLALKWYRGVLGTTGSGTRIGLHLTLAGGLALLAAAIVGRRAGDSDHQVHHTGSIESTEPLDSTEAVDSTEADGSIESVDSTGSTDGADDGSNCADDGSDGDDATDPQRTDASG